MIDDQYKQLIHEILHDGYFKSDRTGVGCKSIVGYQLKHDMSKGFPLLTVRKVPYKSVRVELEGFIKGINSKKWYQDRGCKYWDDWCNPLKVPYSNDPETKAKMVKEDDLGIIYGNNWRDFNDGIAICEGINGVDQFLDLICELKSNPESRRMLVYAWNPLRLNEAALPACHDSFQVLVTGNKLNLIWRQRSVDVILGLPSNIASYATLLHLLALESGLEEGQLVGHLGDCHIYNNASDAAWEYLKREEFDLPTIKTDNFKSIFDWTYDQTKVENYQAHERIKVDVAV